MMDAKVEYLANALAKAHRQYPGMRLDHDGYYEMTYILLDALAAYEATIEGTSWMPRPDNYDSADTAALVLGIEEN